MKKSILIVGLMVSTLAFAKGNGEMTNRKNNDSNTKGNQGKFYNLSEEEKTELLEQREKMHEEMAPYRLDMEEINIGIQREMLNENPDWAKIEKLTKEKAEVKAEMEVIMLKNKNEFGDKSFFFGSMQGGKGGSKGNSRCSNR